MINSENTKQFQQISLPTCGELSVDECNARTATLTAELAKIYSLVAAHGSDLPNGIWETAQAVSDLIARADRAEAEIERWRDSNNRLRAEMELQAQRAAQLNYLWTEFITLMEITEESDSGNAFNPNKISSCRAMDGKRLNEILVEARQIIFKQ